MPNEIQTNRGLMLDFSLLYLLMDRFIMIQQCQLLPPGYIIILGTAMSSRAQESSRDVLCLKHNAQ